MEPKPRLQQQRRGAREMTRLGNRSPSCSGFEAEPLCWLQHSANRWQQDWHSQENSSCGGQRAAERERSSQTEGEDREGGKGVLQGGNPPLCSTGPATPGAGPLCLQLPMSIYICHTSKPRHSRALKDLQGPQASQVSYPRGTPRRPALPLLPCCPYLPASAPLRLGPDGCLA